MVRIPAPSVPDPPAAAACPECGGTGFTIVAREGREFARRCRCVLQARHARLKEDAQIPGRFSACRFSTFEPRHDASLQDALARARRFAEAYPVENERGLLFMGPPGVGKTHLAVSVLHSLMEEKGIPSLFVDYGELLKRIQATYHPGSVVTEQTLLRPVLETEVVLIDDLGGKKDPSFWQFDMMFLIINGRYNARRPTIVTTNFLDEPQIEPSRREGQFPENRDSLEDRITKRIRSRLHEMCHTIPMFGADQRHRRLT